VDGGALVFGVLVNILAAPGDDPQSSSSRRYSLTKDEETDGMMCGSKKDAMQV